MPSISETAYVFQGLARSGRGAGVRHGDWKVRVVESGDIPGDGLLDLDGLREIDLVRNPRTERYLLRPFDVLVTARAGSVQIALVPPQASRTVAGVTLLVVRPRAPDSRTGQYLWYFLSSAFGRSQMLKRLTVSATITSLSATSLGEVEIPMPSHRQLDQVARLVESSEEAYTFAIWAARLRRDTVRDSLIHDIVDDRRFHQIRGETNASDQA